MRQFISLQQQRKMNKTKTKKKNSSKRLIAHTLIVLFLGAVCFGLVYHDMVAFICAAAARTTCSSSSPLNALQTGSESRASRLLYVTFNRIVELWPGWVFHLPYGLGLMRNEITIALVNMQLDKGIMTGTEMKETGA